jgi:hypothetical protein
MTDFNRPDHLPTASYTVEVGPVMAREALQELDQSFIGTDNYLGFVRFWDHLDPFKHQLTETSAWSRKRIHTTLLHNEIPLWSADRTEEQSDMVVAIYKAYL